MKIVVFGGSGFLGSHAADALTAAGHRVTLYDLKPSPYLGRDQKMVVGDVQDEAAVDRVLRGHDAAFNFAGFADLEAAQSHPLETIRANVLGNGVLLEGCRKNRVKRYVFASTVYVYSDAASFYRASKQACEDYIESYRKLFGLPYTILRFGSLYGPRSDRRNSVYGYLRQALEEGKISYWGTGEEVREYIHVEDAAQCCVEALDDKFRDACVLLTGQQAIKVRDLLSMIREIMKRKISVRFRPGSRPDLSGLHYSVTPYAFVPKEAKKLIRRHYVDLGQGLLSVLKEVYGQIGAGR